MCVCVCVRARVYPSKHIHVAVCGPIGIKFGTHMQIHLEKVVGKIKKLLPCDLGAHGFLWGQKLKNGGNTTGGILRGLCGQKLKPGKCGQTAGGIAGCCVCPGKPHHK